MGDLIGAPAPVDLRPATRDPIAYRYPSRGTFRSSVAVHPDGLATVGVLLLQPALDATGAKDSISANAAD